MRKLKIFAAFLIFCLIGPGLTWGETFYTNKRLVTVCLTAFDGGSGIAQMRLGYGNKHETSINADDPPGPNTIFWDSPEEFASERQVQFTSEGDGVKCIFAKFQDKAGNWSEPISACLWLDTVPPTGTIEIGVVIDIDIGIK